MTVYFLPPTAPPHFPPATDADSDGLLCIGGDLSIQRLLAAYKNGIFPWYSDDTPIMWHAPNPRAVLRPERLHISSSMRKFLRKKQFVVTQNRAFDRVIEACQTVFRPDQGGTWITEEMKMAYIAMHKAGHAISFEAWEKEELVGGIYGVIIGGIFFGESMFSHKPNGSKTALIAAVNQMKNHGIELIDIQMTTNHLKSMGSEEMPLMLFLDSVDRLTEKKTNPALLEEKNLSVIPHNS